MVHVVASVRVAMALVEDSAAKMVACRFWNPCVVGWKDATPPITPKSATRTMWVKPGMLVPLCAIIFLRKMESKWKCLSRGPAEDIRNSRNVVQSTARQGMTMCSAPVRQQQGGAIFEIMCLCYRFRE